MKKKYGVLTVSVLITSFFTASAFSATETKQEGKDKEQKIIHEEIWVTPEVQEKQKLEVQEFERRTKSSSVNNNTITIQGRQVVNNSGVSSPGSTYDVETSPIHIGDWNQNECIVGSSGTYARHTIGDVETALSGTKYLTSYGDASYWGSGNALPYKNGNYDLRYPSAAGVDVAMNISFSIRDLKTNIATTLTRTQWGPNQCPGQMFTYRIADLNSSDFRTIHNNTTDGVTYVRTYVPLVNYNPS